MFCVGILMDYVFLLRGRIVSKDYILGFIHGVLAGGVLFVMIMILLNWIVGSC